MWYLIMARIIRCEIRAWIVLSISHWQTTTTALKWCDARIPAWFLAVAAAERGLRMSTRQTIRYSPLLLFWLTNSRSLTCRCRCRIGCYTKNWYRGQQVNRMGFIVLLNHHQLLQILYMLPFHKVERIIGIVNLRLIQRPQERSRGNQLIHRRMIKQTR